MTRAASVSTSNIREVLAVLTVLQYAAVFAAFATATTAFIAWLNQQKQQQQQQQECAQHITFERYLPEVAAVVATACCGFLLYYARLGPLSSAFASHHDEIATNDASAGTVITLKQPKSTTPLHAERADFQTLEPLKQNRRSFDGDSFTDGHADNYSDESSILTGNKTVRADAALKKRNALLREISILTSKTASYATLNKRNTLLRERGCNVPSDIDADNALSEKPNSLAPSPALPRITLLRAERPYNAQSNIDADNALSEKPKSLAPSLALPPAVCLHQSYVHCVDDGMINGDTKGPYPEGVYTFSNGDVYAGELMEDFMEGYGVYVFANSGRYEGQWTAALYEGAGMESLARGTYHGEFSKGMRAGFGICRYHNGDYYEGQWQDGLRHGRGMQQCTDGSNYVGDYDSGKRHGYGVYSFPNGDCYMGAYWADVPYGHGVYLFSSGQKNEGQWHHGKKHGGCVYTFETGDQWAGDWQESRPTWVQSLADPEATRGPHANAVQLSLRAAEEARDAAKDGASRADEHCRTDGPMQLGLRDVVLRADKAAAEAQAARQRALVVAASIDDGRKLAEEGVDASGKSPTALTSNLKKDKSKRMTRCLSGR